MLRWVLFVSALALCTAVILSQPPQEAFAALLLISLGSIFVALLAPRLPHSPRLQRWWDVVDARLTAAISLPALGRVELHRLLLLTVGLGLMYFATRRVIYVFDARQLAEYWYWLPIGLGMTLFLLHGTPTCLTEPLAGPQTVPTVRLRHGWLLLAIGALGFTLLRNVSNPVYFWEQTLTWLFGIFALVKAAQTPAAADPKHLTKMDWLLLILIFCAALLTRGIFIGSEPPWMDQDEAIFAQEGTNIWINGFENSPFRPGFHEHPRMYAGMIAASVAVFDNTLFAARIPSVLLSALTVAGVYLLGRELGGRRLGFVAALFCITWAYHVQFGRLAMNQPGDPLFAVYAFYFFLRGLRLGTPINYIWSGVFLGIAQLFYLGGLSAVATLTAFVIWMAVRQRRLILPQWRQMLLIPLAALLVLIPYYGFLFFYQLPFSTRIDKNIFLNGEWRTAIEHGTLPRFIVEQTGQSFLATIWIEDRGGWYGRGSSILGYVGSAPFVLGAALALILLWRSPKLAFILGWAITVILFGSTFSTIPPQYQRYNSGTSPFALLVALAVIVVAEWLAQKVFRRQQATRALIAALGLALCLGNLAYYLGVYVPTRPYLQNRPNWETNQVALAMVELAEAGRQIILLEAFPTGIMHTLVVGYYMAEYPPILRFDDSSYTLFNPDKPFGFIVPPSRVGEFVSIMKQYPNGRFYGAKLPQDGSIGFFVYERP